MFAPAGDQLAARRNFSRESPMSWVARAWWRRMLRTGRALAAPMAKLLAPTTSAPAEDDCTAVSLPTQELRLAAACGRSPERLESCRGPAAPKGRRMAHARLPDDAGAWQLPVAVTIGPVDWSRLVPRPEAGAGDRRLAGAGRVQR
jgi:hypothetical protein